MNVVALEVHFSIFEPDISVKMGKKGYWIISGMGQRYITATDSSCLMHMEGVAKRNKQNIQFKHIAEILNHSRL